MDIIIILLVLQVLKKEKFKW